MATSGITTFSQTRNQLIQDAFEEIGAYGLGKTISAEDISFASNKLNKMIKAWEKQGIHLFTKQEGVLYLVPGVREYLLGFSANITNASEEIITQLNGDHASLDTTIVVDSTTGMVAGDNIGIVLSDKTIFWTTIAVGGVTSSTTLTLTTGLSGDASDNALIFTYTTAAGKPLRILDCRRRTGIGDSISDLLMEPIGIQDVQSLPSKYTQSSPTVFSVKPFNTYTIMYIWPTASDASERIMYTYERKLEIMNSASNEFDFPEEWLEVLTYQLAIRLASPYGRSSRLRDLLPIASAMLEDAKNWDNEITSIQMVPQL